MLRSKWLCVLGLAVLVLVGGCKAPQGSFAEMKDPEPHDDHRASVAPADALKMLRDGNARFTSEKLTRPNQTAARRTEVAKGQYPFAVVLTCSDSRVPPEMIFDTGLGDLFVVRVAGNTADDTAIGSIEYAVEHLGATLVVVLGHDKCGAVKAAIDVTEADITAPGHLPAVVGPIVPAVKQTKDQPGDKLENGVRANVANVVEQLKMSHPVLAERVASGKLQIIGGRYDLSSGVAELK